MSLVLLAGACDDGGPTDQAAFVGDLEVAAGTSFGECLGYCVTELVLEDATARLTETAWDSGSYPPTTRQLDLTTAHWEQIRDAVDLAAFASLEGVHGCPDCADGGAEWIELRTPTDTIRVTFEYGDVLPQIAALQAAVRAQRQRFE